MVFNDSLFSRQQVPFILSQVKQCLNAWNTNSKQQKGGGRKVEKLVGWSFLNTGWIKVNSDRVAKGNPGLTGAGTMIQNIEGVWISGKAASLGVISSVTAEI